MLGQPRKSYGDIREILDNITFLNYKLRLLEKGDGFLLQVEVVIPDAVTGHSSLQKGRKWYISAHSTETELVRTAFKALDAFVHHELEENFKYKHVSVYNPHTEINELAYIVYEGRLDKRIPIPEELVADPEE